MIPRVCNEDVLRRLLIGRRQYTTYYLACWDWLSGTSECPAVPAECSPLVASAIRQYLTAVERERHQ